MTLAMIFFSIKGWLFQNQHNQLAN